MCQLKTNFTHETPILKVITDNNIDTGGEDKWEAQEYAILMRTPA